MAGRRRAHTPRTQQDGHCKTRRHDQVVRRVCQGRPGQATSTPAMAGQAQPQCSRRAPGRGRLLVGLALAAIHLPDVDAELHIILHGAIMSGRGLETGDKNHILMPPSLRYLLGCAAPRPPAGIWARTARTARPPPARGAGWACAAPSQRVVPHFLCTQHQHAHRPPPSPARGTGWAALALPPRGAACSLPPARPCPGTSSAQPPCRRRGCPTWRACGPAREDGGWAAWLVAAKTRRLAWQGPAALGAGVGSMHASPAQAQQVGWPMTSTCCACVGDACMLPGWAPPAGAGGGEGGPSPPPPPGRQAAAAGALQTSAPPLTLCRWQPP